MDNPKLYLSSNLKFLRLQKGKTQEEVGAICHKKNTAVNNWEKGIREPDAVDLALLSNYFNVSINDLMLMDLRIMKDTKKTLFKKNGVEITICHDGEIDDKMLLEVNNLLLQEKILKEELKKSDKQS